MQFQCRGCRWVVFDEKPADNLKITLYNRFNQMQKIRAPSHALSEKLPFFVSVFVLTLHWPNM